MLRAKRTAVQPADTVLPFPWLAGHTSLSLSSPCTGFYSSYKGKLRKVEGISLSGVDSKEK